MSAADSGHHSDDEELLARFAGGERSALEELFHRYRVHAHRVAYRLLGNEADALDAVQEGFVKALVHLAGFQGRASFKTWLLRVVYNAALDLGRHRGRREMRSLDSGSGVEQTHAVLLVHQETGRRLEQADLRQALDAALATLSDVQRQTFVLHADAELTYREIAEVMRTSIGTVMSRLYYARQKLRVLLHEQTVP